MPGATRLARSSRSRRLFASSLVAIDVCNSDSATSILASLLDSSSRANSVSTKATRSPALDHVALDQLAIGLHHVADCADARVAGRRSDATSDRRRPFRAFRRSPDQPVRRFLVRMPTIQLFASDFSCRAEQIRPVSLPSREHEVTVALRRHFQAEDRFERDRRGIVKVPVTARHC